MNEVIVTVIMCVYNTPQEHLNLAVKSILEQSFESLELIIIDDASEKKLYIGDMFTDAKITILRNERNLGPASSRNRALDIARGRYIAIMDSDDISLPNRIKEQVRFMKENPDVCVCGTWFQQFGNKNNTVCREIDDNEYYRCCLLFGNAPTILNPSVMIRRNILDETGFRYNPVLRKGEDYDMWVKLSQHGRCTNIKQVLLKYRVHGNQTSERLRTKGVSDYDWVVLKEQYDKLGLNIGQEDESYLRLDYRSKNVDASWYRKWLHRIIDANRKSGVYDQMKLEKRVEEQWVQKIYNTKGISELMGLMRKLGVKETAHIIGIEMARIRRKVVK